MRPILIASIIVLIVSKFRVLVSIQFQDIKIQQFNPIKAIYEVISASWMLSSSNVICIFMQYVVFIK